MSHRFFLAQPPLDDRAQLTGSEARHLAQVLRAAAGDEVTLFDGSGLEYRARVVSVGKQAVELAVLSRQQIERESSIELTLAVALPKGDRQAWLVEKCVELGVARLVPLITSRGVAQPVASARERIERWIVEATKQCGRGRLLELAENQTCAELFERTAPETGARIVTHPHGADRPWKTLDEHAVSRWTIAIGPEGGFTDDEIARARAAGWTVASLGARILRVETAALAVAVAASLASDR